MDLAKEHNALPTAVRAVRRSIETLGYYMNIAAGWTYVACAAFIIFDVLARSLLGFSSASTIELSGYMLACGISWSLAHALAERAHVRVDTLVNIAPLVLQSYLHVLALKLLLGFSCFLTWSGYQLVSESLLFNAHDSSALYIPLAVPQTIWLIGLAGLTLMCLSLLLEAVLMLMAGDHEGTVELLQSRTIKDEAKEALEAAGGPEQ